MTDDQIADLVVKSEATGKALGLRSERGQARWTYLMMMTGGQAANTHEATDFIRQGANPDRQVKELIDLTAKALRASAGGAGAY